MANVLPSIPIAIHIEQPPNYLECPICIGPIRVNDIITTTRCNHTFHQNCLQPWLLRHSTCPICRTLLRVAIASYTVVRMIISYIIISLILGVILGNVVLFTDRLEEAQTLALLNLLACTIITILNLMFVLPNINIVRFFLKIFIFIYKILISAILFMLFVCVLISKKTILSGSIYFQILIAYDALQIIMITKDLNNPASNIIDNAIMAHHLEVADL